MEDVNLPIDIDSDDDDYTMETKYAAPQKLEEGIYIKDLIGKAGSEFTLKTPNNFGDDDDQKSYFTDEQLLMHSRRECIGTEDDDAESADDEDITRTPFDVLATKMTNVTPDGKLKKRMMKEGSGDTVPAGALVTMQYNGYREFDEEPFDSTFLRRLPRSVRLGQGAVIIGLEEAVMSMKKGERSQFLIHYDLGFGVRGCPPRIPPAATLMFEVTIENFVDKLAGDVYDSMTELEKKEASFEKHMEASKAYHLAGVELFKKQAYGPAVGKFNRALSFLEQMGSMKDVKEEEQQQKLMLKLHVNLAVCYNWMKQPERACTNCQEALKIDRHNAKANFNYGRAMLMLSNFPEAQHRFLRAQRKEPHNEKINEYLVMLEEKKSRFSESEKSQAFLMMKDCRITTPAEQELAKMPESDRKFLCLLRKKLENFVNTPELKRLDFPPCVGAQEEKVMKDEAQKLGLFFIMIKGVEGAASHIVISKSTLQAKK